MNQSRLALILDSDFHRAVGDMQPFFSVRLGDELAT